ncbi:MAG: hypothetical protein BGO69_16410 [Bacteroidetes bacterium 46-16]|nr:MAG: hypothetical protein BGO69_16410 [Bacteroidetes bacterium 46-16]
MKNTIFLLLLAVISSSVTATPLHRKDMSREQHRQWNDRFKNYLLSHNLPTVQAKATQLGERLKADCSRFNNTWQLDSNVYVYSNGRGSKFNNNFMGFTNEYLLDGSYYFDFYSYSGLYDTPNDRPDVQADTMKMWLADPFTPLSPLSKWKDRISQYNAVNNVTSIVELLEDSSGDWNTRYLNTFDNQQRIVTSVYQERSGGPQWDSVELRRFTYNASGRLISDSTWQHAPNSWEVIERNDYEYNANGNMIKTTSLYYNAPTWIPSESYTMTYDAGNRLSTYFDSTYNGNWQPVSRDSFGYNGIDPFYVFDRYDDYSPSAIIDYTITTKHITAGLVDTVFSASYDATTMMLTSKEFIAYTYDTYDQPVTAQEHLWNDTTQQYYSDPGNSTYFYYETYTLGVDEATAASRDVTIYPNPANNSIAVTYTGACTDGRLEIYNITGQLVLTAALKGTRNMIPVECLSPGFYLCKTVIDGKSAVQKLLINR